MSNKEKFIATASVIHNNKYLYDDILYVNNKTKVKIICPEHGEFWQRPDNHISGQGCPQCGGTKKLTKDEFIAKSREIHGDKYDYSKVEYINNSTKVCIICPEHGEFWQRPSLHMNGSGCPHCYGNAKLSTNEFIDRAKEIHGDKYDYSKVEYNGVDTKVCIICPEHGEFWQTPYNHMNGQGCPKCYGFNKTTEDFIKKAIEVHGNKYDYSKTKYINAKEKVTITCPMHGDFEQRPNDHLNGHGCSICGTEIAYNSSMAEDEIVSFIKSNYNGEVIENDRTILAPMEVDIYIPDLKVAFEYDGLYWHNELNKPDRKYHLNKTKECEKLGIQLIHIFEDEWVHKQDIVKSRIKNILKITSNRIYARKCLIKDIDSKTANEFLRINHIQGASKAKFRYGLYYNDELVSLMTFGGLRKNLGRNSKDGHYELVRFCNKLDTTVIGGASKLLKHFVNEVKPVEIISYADKRWSNGNLYKKLNFKLSHESQPSYFYVINDKRENRFKYRKDILIREGFDGSKTEHQIMLDRGIYRIYDCGCKVYKWKREN